MKLAALREGFSHMGQHSGYDCLFNALSSNVKLTSIWKNASERKTFKIPRYSHWKKPFPLHSGIWNEFNFHCRPAHYQTNLLRNIKHQTSRTSTNFYTLDSLGAEMDLLYTLQDSDTDLIHYSYIENQWGLFASPLFIDQLLQTPMIGTLHQTYEWWLENGHIEALDRFDQLIVLTEAETPKWQKHFSEKITFIPHGVDTSFFAPNDSKNSRFTCVFSGYWMRDFEFLKAVIDRTFLKLKSVQFKLIIPEKNMNEVQTLIGSDSSQIEFLSGLTDEELVRAYSDSHILILPLKSCTANNALLEGLSCGLPVLTSKIDGVKSYLSSNTGKACSSPDEMTEHIIKYHDNPELLATHAAEARKTALNFSWSMVAYKWEDLANQTLGR